MSIRIIEENEKYISFLQVMFDMNEPDPYKLTDMSISHKPFPLIFADAVWFVHEVCQKDDKKVTQAIRAFTHFAILGLALAVEAAANCCIASLSFNGKTTNEIERLPALGKFDVFALSKGAGSCLDRGNSHVQAIHDILKLRDIVVHGKVIPVQYNGKNKKGDGIRRKNTPRHSKHLHIPMEPSLWNPEHTKLALKETCDFFNYFFLEICSMQPQQSRKLLSSVMSESEQPVAVLDDMPNHILFIMSEWKISMKFLCMARKPVYNKEGTIIDWEFV